MFELTMHLDEPTYQILLQRARQHQRSVEEETLAILRRALLEERDLIVQQLQQLHARLGQAHFASSAELIREDRER